LPVLSDPWQLVQVLPQVLLVVVQVLLPVQ
jgi:hypothetical protein